MSAPIEKLKLSKSERKALKKQARSRQTLMKHDGIHTVDQPTRMLCVANAGLGNGVSHEELQNVFKKFGNINKIDMPPGRPYAFVEFSTVAESTSARDSVNGKEMKEEVSLKGVKFYTTFVEEGPTATSSCGSRLPPGLVMLENSITEGEENKLLASIDWSGYTSSMKHRRVKHYGYEFLYSTNNVDVNKPLEDKIPKECLPILTRLLEAGHIREMPDQLTVNEYLPGQGIPPHIDTHSAFHDEIISLALGSQVVMDFKHPSGEHIPVPIPRRCIIIMTKESRYVWTHGITPRKSDIVPLSFAQKCQQNNEDEKEGGLTEGEVMNDQSQTLLKRGVRTSFTFRKVRLTPCDCAFPEHCDSQTSLPVTPKASLPESQLEALHLEATHVHKVYDEIAGHFSDTRHTPWPRIVEFLKSQPVGSILADVGCGNGKYLGVNQSLYELGCERSPNLSSICHERHFNICVADILQTPLRDESVDVCLCIAVIHHLSTELRRLEAVKELIRITRPGGKILIYVWALEQELHKVKSNYLKEKQFTVNNVQQNDGVRDVNNGMNKLISSKAISESSQNAAGDSQNTYENTQNPLSEGDINSASFDESTIKDSKAENCDTEQSPIKCLPIHVNRTQFAKPDLLVPWHLKSTQRSKEEKETGLQDHVFHRYYHVFHEGELVTMCQEISNVTVEDQYYDKGNWCVVLQKL